MAKVQQVGARGCGSIVRGNQKACLGGRDGCGGDIVAGTQPTEQQPVPAPMPPGLWIASFPFKSCSWLLTLHPIRCFPRRRRHRRNAPTAGSCGRRRLGWRPGRSARADQVRLPGWRHENGCLSVAWPQRATRAAVEAFVLMRQWLPPRDGRPTLTRAPIPHYIPTHPSPQWMHSKSATTTPMWWPRWRGCSGTTARWTRRGPGSTVQSRSTQVGGWMGGLRGGEVAWG